MHAHAKTHTHTHPHTSFVFTEVKKWSWNQGMARYTVNKWKMYAKKGKVSSLGKTSAPTIHDERLYASLFKCHVNTSFSQKQSVSKNQLLLLQNSWKSSSNSDEQHSDREHALLLKKLDIPPVFPFKIKAHLESGDFPEVRGRAQRAGLTEWPQSGAGNHGIRESCCLSNGSLV